jgi:PAS domain S-box-containing protein
MGDQEPMRERVFLGGSVMARRMRALDWSKTPLGTVEEWPQPLLTSVGICLDCAFPIVLWWGPELAILYNDEYRTFLGPNKDPAALGERGSKVWAEIWDVIAPMLDHVIQTGEATRSRDLLLHIDREGYQEEAYFSFSYSPIYDQTGKVGGIFCPVIETTEKIISERRLRTLRDLAASCVGADREEGVYAAAASVLRANLHDVPFSLIYRIDEERSVAELQSSSGIAAGSRGAPRIVNLDRDDPGTWSLGTVACTGKTAVIDGLSTRFPRLPAGAWKSPPSKALALPVLLPGQDRPRAVLIAAVSPMRALDEDYRTFYGLVATQIASGLADAQAMEAERRQVEALAEIDRAKTAFFSNVSHEFRTPLTLMLAPLEDLLGDAAHTLPEDVRGMVRVVHRNSMRLLKLVNTLLDFARIEAGRVEASYEPTDLCALTTELASVFRSAVERAGLQLRVECAALPEPAYVDRDMWEKIVLNLLSNAFKFTFDGSIAIELRARGHRAELSVSDTGVGIAAADLPRMFERFHRVKNARSRTHEGTGIGLALVHELTKLHGGDVSVDSTEGVGSTFTVSIPLGRAHLPQERIGAARTLATTAMSAMPFVEEALRWLPGWSDETSLHPAQRDEPERPFGSARPQGAQLARVLVADDNADMRDYLYRLLSSDYAVTVVPDGHAALEHIRNDPPDLVVTDVMMPRLDGFGLLAAVRAGEKTRSLPVIMLSARAGEEARIEGVNAGADAYLIKPFSARELLSRIASQLELARLRREVEQELRNRGEQFVTLFNQAPLGVYLVDSQLRIREVNPIALPVFGDIPGGIRGRDFDQIIHLLWDKPYADEVVRIFRHTLETGESYIEPERGEVRRDRGVTEYYEWRLDRIALPDGTWGAVCYFRDVSAQVHARKLIEESKEALEAADRRKNEFLATLAHELRNPLSAIGNSVHLLRHQGQNTWGPDEVRRIFERQVKHLVRLVDDLMDVSRITRGKIELRKERVELAGVLKSAIETASPLIEQRRHRLDVSLPHDPIYVDADAVRLSQVFANLLNNAAKYTDDGGHLWLIVRREEGNVIVAVRDSGIGIPGDMLPKVFDLFMQVDASYSRSRGGLGIGLTLARDLVRMHAGSIEAKSAGIGSGSEFVVTLPVLADAETTAEPPGTAESETRIEERILLVEDDPDASESLRLLLTMMGADVCTASSGPAALKVLGSYQPTVVVLDIGMPGMDGYEVARRVRTQTNGAPLTLVALSGWGQEEDRRRSREAGIDYHLVKPVDVNALQSLLTTAGSRSRGSQPPVSERSGHRPS